MKKLKNDPRRDSIKRRWFPEKAHMFDRGTDGRYRLRSDEEKLEILNILEELPYGQQAEFLRQHHLSTAHIVYWRKRYRTLAEMYLPDMPDTTPATPAPTEISVPAQEEQPIAADRPGDLPVDDSDDDIPSPRSFDPAKTRA